LIGPCFDEAVFDLDETLGEALAICV